MKIGYPCINNSVNCTSNRTFRLASYSDKRLRMTIAQNLQCLQTILAYNVFNDILFFRIGSGIIPFASHPVCSLNWQNECAETLATLGEYMKKHSMRISMHPDQFIVINSPRSEVVKKSIEELAYQCQFLDLLGLPPSAKVVIHCGGMYNDKENAIRRFVDIYNNLDSQIKKRLVIEHDERLYSVDDCMNIFKETGIPVVFDTFHHQGKNNGESLNAAFTTIKNTWHISDGPPIVHYSSQQKNATFGKHADTLDTNHFLSVMDALHKEDFDLMLEIKDKEKSVLKALRVIKKLYKNS